MARPFTKSLEEQLTTAQEELKKAEDKVVTLKQKISDLNHAIRERDKENVFALLEAQGMSVEDFKEFLAAKNIIEDTEEKVVNIKKKRA